MKRKIPLAEVDIGAGEGRTHAQPCAAPGCRKAGEHKAPKSKHGDGHLWFCLEHVREYNLRWNYFADMTPDQIEAFQRESVTGNRPTWRLGARAGKAWHMLHKGDQFQILGDILDDVPEATHGRATSPKERRALQELELSATVSLQEIKMRYKQLVKRYHPDANGGDKAAEERFKCINEAYSFLLTCGYS